MDTDVSRRAFLTSVSMLAAGSLLTSPLKAALGGGEKIKIVLVGTGNRGITFWGKNLKKKYPELIEFVGLCDINPGRLAYAKEFMGVDCPTSADFVQLVKNTKPNLVIVTTMDSAHHEYVVKALDLDIDVLTEKPMTTDESKCQQILDAERRAQRRSKRAKVIVGFNYRWSPYMTQIKSLLASGEIGDVVSVDFNWMLNTSHGSAYFHRWHGQREFGGTLLVHKSTHHFDLLNWWLDSDPEEVFAYGSLEHYGSNGKFRGDSCRTCKHTKECDYFYDIMKPRNTRGGLPADHFIKLYVDNEHHDGYLRDGCVYRKEINIYDKMSTQIKYANNVVANYSLTTYSPYEGWKITFNGTKGRLEAWLGIPHMSNDEMIDQDELHELEMSQEGQEKLRHSPIIVHKLWPTKNKLPNKGLEKIIVSYARGGHGGGDVRLHNKIFVDPGAPDPHKHSAGARDGAMSVMIGVAARKSIESGQPVRIASLIDLEPRAKRI